MNDELGLNKDLREALKADLNALLDEKRDACASVLKQYMLDNLRVTDDPSLAKRMEEFNKRIDTMVETMTLDIDDKKGEAVVKATGSGEDTWKTILRGSDWFMPVPNAMEIMLSPLCQ